MSVRREVHGAAMLDIRDETRSRPAVAARERVAPSGDETSLEKVLGRLSEPVLVLDKGGQLSFLPGVGLDSVAEVGKECRVAGYLPPVPLRNLGDPAFCRDHRLRYAYRHQCAACRRPTERSVGDHLALRWECQPE